MNRRMKSTLIVALSFLAFFEVKAQDRDLPDTGQTGDYTAVFFFFLDYTWNAPDLTDNSDSTITDNVTGLTWQKIDGGEMTWEDAVIYASNLTLGGYSDWRLPTSHELLNILNHGMHPSIDETYFQYDDNDFWWGAAQYVGDTAKIWVANAGGGVGPHDRSESLSAGGDKSFHPRCVRGSIITSSFTDNSDGTVTDARTNLMWSQSAFSDLAWEDAVTFAESSSYANYSDWRLPNVKELRSISEDEYTGPSVNPNFFSFISSNYYWSSSTESNNGSGWVASFDDGRVGSETKTLEHGVLLVRYTSSVGINEMDRQNAISIYPNPSNDFIQIMELTKNLSYSIYNMLGKEVGNGAVSSDEKIDIQHLPNGLFFIKISDGKTMKFIKE